MRQRDKWLFDVTFSRMNLFIKEFLIAALLFIGADINARNKNGNTLLHFSSYYFDKELIEFLFEYGADPNIKDRKGQSAFHNVIEFNDRILFAMFLSLKGKRAVDINLPTTEEGYTPLILAIRLEREKMAEDLISIGADIDAKDKKGMNAFHWTIYKSMVGLAARLIRRGTNVKELGPNGMTPINMARKYAREKILDMIEEELR